MAPCEDRFSWLTPPEAAQSPGLRDAWERLLQASDNPYALNQSPPMWDYFLRQLEPAQRCALGIVRAGDGGLAGAVPVRTARYALRFETRGRTVCNLPLRVVQVLGGQPLIAGGEGSFVGLVRNLFAAFPECDAVEVPNLLLPSASGRIVGESRRLREEAIVYFPEAPTHLHLIVLPESFAVYLAKFKSKTRYNLRREVKRLRERGGGRLDLVRVEREEDLPGFLDVAAPLSAQSRQCKLRGWRIENSAAERAALAELAAAAALRSYYLRCGETPCAYVKGFQYHHTYYYNQIGFHEGFAEHSPGTVLLYLLLEDLFAHRPPRRVNLYSGDWWYKDLFATDFLPERRTFLLRKTLANRLRVAAHAGFRRSVAAVRRLLPSKRAQGARQEC